MKAILTNNGLYEYKPIALFHGRKKINVEICKENLMLFKSVLDRHGVVFGIIYGTLLGAIRDNSFIEYDEDVDVFVLDECRLDFLSLLFDLRLCGFEVARYSGDLLSVIRQNDYIDVYFFKSQNFFWRKCGSDRLPAKFFSNLDKVNFLNDDFFAPNNHLKFLETAYGEDWRIPKRDCPANVMSIVSKLKQIAVRFLPDIILNFLKKFR